MSAVATGILIHTDDHIIVFPHMHGFVSYLKSLTSRELYIIVHYSCSAKLWLYIICDVNTVSSARESNILKRWPRSLEGAVQSALSSMSDKHKKIVKDSNKKNLKNFHTSLGKKIRNEFGLWEGNDELLISCGTLNPDNASMVIIRAIWKALQNEVT